MVTPMTTALGLAMPLLAVNALDSPLLYLIGGGGLVTLVTVGANLVRDFAKGIPQQKALREADMKQQRDTAWAERDAAWESRQREARRAACEAGNRRRTDEWSSLLVRILNEAGLPYPPRPQMLDCENLSKEG